jgi:hypothetical protein
MKDVWKRIAHITHAEWCAILNALPPLPSPRGRIEGKPEVCGIKKTAGKTKAKKRRVAVPDALVREIDSINRNPRP